MLPYVKVQAFKKDIERQWDFALNETLIKSCQPFFTNDIYKFVIRCFN